MWKLTIYHMEGWFQSGTFLKKVGILWNSTFVLKEDKLSTTTVVFIRSEGKLKTKHLYWIWKPNKC